MFDNHLMTLSPTEVMRISWVPEDNMYKGESDYQFLSAGKITYHKNNTEEVLILDSPAEMNVQHSSYSPPIPDPPPLRQQRAFQRGHPNGGERDGEGGGESSSIAH